MKAYSLAEFPMPGIFPIEVVGSSHQAALHGLERSRKGYTWATAMVGLRGHVLAVKLAKENRVAIWSPTDPGSSCRVEAELTAGGLVVSSICNLGDIEGAVVSEAETPPGFHGWERGVNHLGLVIATDRSRHSYDRSRFMKDPRWMSADLSALWDHLWLRAEVNASGRVWIGTPGRGLALSGTLGHHGLSLVASDPMSTLGRGAGESDSGRAE